MAGGVKGGCAKEDESAVNISSRIYSTADILQSTAISSLTLKSSITVLIFMRRRHLPRLTAGGFLSAGWE